MGRQVLGLGEELTSVDTFTRARGTLLLAEVLCGLPQVPARAAEHLGLFFASRMADWCAARRGVLFCHR
jgi:hypothetical protein